MVKPKILILSEEDDGTTDTVIKWIRYFGGDCLRINDTSLLEFSFIQLSGDSDEVQFSYKSKTYPLSEFTGYWYRRGKLNFNYPKISFHNKKLHETVEKMLSREYSYINNYIYNYVEKKENIKSIGSIFDNQTNKVTNLLTARKMGLQIPETIIATTKKQVFQFRNKHPILLVKPIYQAGFLYEEEDMRTSGLSAIMDNMDIEKLPDTFPPSLIQGYVEKKYELRIFYLNGECFASAIFSQLDEQTKIDFRNYNWQKPNRTPPYKLPAKVNTAIKKFMTKVEMNSGSIDMIVTPNKNYVFLEVNPVGQFWQVSYPCNYYLEKKIAQYLCSK